MRLPIAALLLAAAGLSSVQAQPGGSAQPPLLVHGHYCGLGNRAPLPPVDALDAACARHDACTYPGRLPSRSCNLRLFWEADLISRDPRQPDDVRAAAGFVAFGASLLPFDTTPRPVVVGVPGWSGPYAPRRLRALYAH
ncbi:MAG: hypothetical protein K2X71_09255 [Methylobacterium sp.]|uniref:hypothetical protein n=1 Tax=Methylobacterium sp. TaxID=409 RepID=UPI002584A95A|nr:hypothetical protein [Methylobacterium sp.]MBY0296213.1 hypothetical protein [Methylobacterium sp.]